MYEIEKDKLKATCVICCNVELFVFHDQKGRIIDPPKEAKEHVKNIIIDYYICPDCSYPTHDYY